MSLDLWHRWNDGQRKQQFLPPLMNAYKPFVEREVSRWSASGLPRVVLSAEAKRLTLNAFQTYNPTKNVQLQTHVVNHLKGLGRFVSTYRDDIRMPEEKANLAGKVFRAKQELELELGREATPQEISERSGVGMHTIGTLKKFQAGLYSANENSGFNQPVREDIDHQEIIANFLYHDLSPKQKLVFEHSVGFNGKPVLSPGEIAQKLKVTPARVSILKTQIADKARAYQGAVNSLMN